MEDRWLTTANHNGRMTCRGKEFGPQFVDKADCDGFIKYVCDRTGMDPRQQSDEWIERTAEAWVIA